MIAEPSSIDGSWNPSPQLGKYQLIAKLGQGGMGTVHLALASGFGQFRKLLVLKELRQDLTRRGGFVRMFMDEAKLAARLSHPNVVQTFEASEVGDRYFFAMEYLDGQSLSALLGRLAQTNVRLPLCMHIQILCEALSGLHYAHELLDYDGTSLQVVHRDVSPQNVFVTYHGQVKVVDFGVAKVANASVKTAPGMFVGRLRYAAPELVLGQAVDARSDVFAVGVMLWQAIAGRPFSDQSPTAAACRARAEGREARIAEAVPEVDPELAKICDRALQVNPDERYASAQELRSELQAYLQHSGVRVEAPEIGLLVREAFDTERRTLHAHVERAMRPTPELLSLHPGESLESASDKDRTMVADLSSLVDVSLEHDDQKIREVYAHSKVTLVRSPREQGEAVMMQGLRVHGKRLLVASGVSLAALVAVLLAVALGQPGSREQHEIIARPLAPTETSIALASDAHVERGPVLAASNETTAAAPSDATGSAREAKPSRAIEAQPRLLHTSTLTGRRSRNASVSQATQLSAHEPPTPAAAVSDPVAPQRLAEEGADLMLLGRRAGKSARIDRENPYR